MAAVAMIFPPLALTVNHLPLIDVLMPFLPKLNQETESILIDFQDVRPTARLFVDNIAQHRENHSAENNSAGIAWIPLHRKILGRCGSPQLPRKRPNNCKTGEASCVLPSGSKRATQLADT
jgi:hypothetical protein